MKERGWDKGTVWEYVKPSIKKQNMQVIITHCGEQIVQFITIDGRRREQAYWWWFLRHYKKIGSII